MDLLDDIDNLQKKQSHGRAAFKPRLNVKAKQHVPSSASGQPSASTQDAPSSLQPATSAAANNHAKPFIRPSMSSQRQHVPGIQVTQDSAASTQLASKQPTLNVGGQLGEKVANTGKDAAVSTAVHAVPATAVADEDISAIPVQGIDVVNSQACQGTQGHLQASQAPRSSALPLTQSIQAPVQGSTQPSSTPAPSHAPDHTQESNEQAVLISTVEPSNVAPQTEVNTSYEVLPQERNTPVPVDNTNDSNHPRASEQQVAIPSNFTQTERLHTAVMPPTGSQPETSQCQPLNDTSQPVDAETADVQPAQVADATQETLQKPGNNQKDVQKLTGAARRKLSVRARIASTAQANAETEPAEDNTAAGPSVRPTRSRAKATAATQKVTKESQSKSTERQAKAVAQRPGSTRSRRKQAKPTELDSEDETMRQEEPENKVVQATSTRGRRGKPAQKKQVDDEDAANEVEAEHNSEEGSDDDSSASSDDVISLTSDSGSDGPKKRRKRKASKSKRQKVAATGSKPQRCSRQRAKSPGSQEATVTQRLLAGVQSGEGDSSVQREKAEKELQEVESKEQSLIQRLPSLQVTERVLAELELRQLAQRRQALQQWRAILVALSDNGNAPTPPVPVASSLHKRPRRATAKALKYAENSAEDSEDTLQSSEEHGNRKKARKGRSHSEDGTAKPDATNTTDDVAETSKQAAVPVPVPVPDESKLPTRKRGRNPKIPPLSERLKATAPAPANTDVGPAAATTQPSTRVEPITQSQDAQQPVVNSTVQPASGYDSLLAAAADNMQQRADGDAQQQGGGRRRARPTIKPRVQTASKEAGAGAAGTSTNGQQQPAEDVQQTGSPADESLAIVPQEGPRAIISSRALVTRQPTDIGPSTGRPPGVKDSKPHRAAPGTSRRYKQRMLNALIHNENMLALLSLPPELQERAAMLQAKGAVLREQLAAARERGKKGIGSSPLPSPSSQQQAAQAQGSAAGLLENGEQGSPDASGGGQAADDALSLMIVPESHKKDIVHVREYLQQRLGQVLESLTPKDIELALRPRPNRLPSVPADATIDKDTWSLKQIIAKTQAWDRQQFMKHKHQQASKRQQALERNPLARTAEEEFDHEEPAFAVGSDDDDQQPGGSESREMKGPRVRIDENGRVIVDESSLQVQAQHNELATYHRVEEDGGRMLNSRTYSRRNTTSDRWNEEDTALFYRALRAFGTDFTLISELFPARDRRQIKNKFNKEEREKPDEVREALHPKSVDGADRTNLLAVIKERLLKRSKTKQLTAGEERPALPAPSTEDGRAEGSEGEPDVDLDQDAKSSGRPAGGRGRGRPRGSGKPHAGKDQEQDHQSNGNNQQGDVVQQQEDVDEMEAAYNATATGYEAEEEEYYY